MNYFPIFACPRESAEALDDKRLIRIFSEAVMTLGRHEYLKRDAQRISVLAIPNRLEKGIPYWNVPIPPKLIAWLGHEPRAIDWHRRWVQALLRELCYRFGARVLQYKATIALLDLYPEARFTPSSETPKTFVNLAKSVAKDLDYTHYQCTHKAYRDYLCFQWDNVDVRKPLWTKRERPAFYPEMF